MARKGKKHRWPRSPNIVQGRIEEVQTWLAEFVSQKACVARLGEKGVSPRQAYRYVALARAQWLKDAAAARPALVEQRIHRMVALARKYENDEPQACIQAEKEINRILGVSAPDRIDVRAQVAVAQVGPPALDLTMLADDELDALERAMGRLHRGPVLDVPALKP